MQNTLPLYASRSETSQVLVIRTRCKSRLLLRKYSGCRPQLSADSLYEDDATSDILLLCSATRDALRPRVYSEVNLFAASSGSG